MSAIVLPKGDMDWKVADVTGDFGNGLEAISLCDFGSSDLFAGNWPHGVLGVLQHYRHEPDLALSVVRVAIREKADIPRATQLGSE